MNRNLKSYQVIQHTQLNLFQSSNAISLLITAWCSRGCPQLAASCDTLTPCRIVIVFQLQLLRNPFRHRWLVSSTLYFICLFSLFPFFCLVWCQRIVCYSNERAINWNDYFYVFCVMLGIPVHMKHLNAPALCMYLLRHAHSNVMSIDFTWGGGFCK